MIDSSTVRTETCPVCRTGHDAPMCAATPRHWLAALNLRLQFEPDYSDALERTALEFGLTNAQVVELHELYAQQDLV